MLAAAPNLKRIIVHDDVALKFLPSEKYNLLNKIPFHVKIPEQEELFRKIVEAKPKLAELRIIPPFVGIFDGGGDSDDEDSADLAVQQRSDRALELLL